MRFHSRVDWFNILMLLIISAGLITPLFLIGFSVWYLAIVVALVVFMCVIMFGTYYKLGSEEIVIRNGFSSFSLSYDSIKKISLVKNFKISSKTALKGIELGYKYSKSSALIKVYVSPSKEDKFLKELKNRCEEVSEIIDIRSEASEK